MDLLDIVQEIVQKNMTAAQLTDLRIGTVTKASPLEITTDISAQPLQAQILYLTDAVVEKKLSTQPALSNVAFTVNGQAVPASSGGIVLSPALAVGDKVILLRVQNGQKYIVLSRVYGGGG